MRLKRGAAALVVIASLSMALAGCGGPKSYADGTYEGKSSVYEDNDGEGDGYGEVSITIKDGKITDCTFNTYETNGDLKDEDYGKQNGEVANQDFYNKAQKALAGSKEYAKMLVETGDYHAIDAISGATISYNQFMEAVDEALSKAEE
ncbi:MAG: FMN-binding protein [Eubacterium sp.]|nr:FMN-binding protein [Eubacterium sp.]